MLNLENIGRPLVKIEGGKLNNKIVSVNTDNDLKKKIKYPFNSLNIEEEAKFQHIPNKKANREVLYCAGPSGSGKSTYTKNYIKQLLKNNKKLDVFLFSPFKEDPSLDDIKPQRIKIDESLVDNPIKPEDLANSVVIFDDIDSIKNKEIRKAIYELLNQCLEIGRHFDIHVIQTNHILCANNDTKRILNEAHHITFFPHSGSISTLGRLCEAYGGIDKEQLKKIRKTESRWATIHKNYPTVISTEHHVWHPVDDSDEEEEGMNIVIESKPKITRKKK